MSQTKKGLSVLLSVALLLLFTTQARLVRGTEESSGLLAHWKLERNGNNAVAGGAALNMETGSRTCYDTVEHVPGIQIFNDTTLGNKPEAQWNSKLGNSFSIAFFFRTTWNDVSVLFGNGSKEAAGHFECYLIGGQLAFYSTELGDFSSGTVVNDGKLHHAAVTYNGTAISFYVDGLLVKTTDAAGSMTDLENAAFYIGALPDDVFAYKGFLGDLRIYSGVLTGQEVADFYAAYFGKEGPSVTSVIPAAHYPFDADGADRQDGAGDFSVDPGWFCTVGKHKGILLPGDRGLWVENCSVPMRDQFTISLFFQAAPSDQYRVLAAKSTKADGASHFEIYLHPDGFVATYMPGLTRDGTLFLMGDRVDDGMLHHLAVCYNGKIMTVYLDGIYRDMLDMNGSIAEAYSILSVGQLAESGMFFDGFLDDFRIYTSALTSEQIAELAASDDSSEEPNPPSGNSLSYLFGIFVALMVSLYLGKQKIISQ